MIHKKTHQVIILKSPDKKKRENYHAQKGYFNKYALIYVLEEKYRKSKDALKNMLRNFFDGTCTVELSLKVTKYDF